MTLRVYLDANALIKAVEAEDTVAIVLKDLLASGDIAILSSELTLAEVLVVPLRRLQAQPSDRMAQVWRSTYETFFRKAGTVQAIPVSAAVLFNAAELRARHKALRLPDAIHLATALSAQCSVVVTHDGDFLRASISYMTTCPLIEAELITLIEKAASRT